MASERLVIATSDDRKSKFLSRYLSHASPRFESHCTSDTRILQTAMGDDGVSAVVADARMLASLHWEGPVTRRRTAAQKPIVLSPSLSRAHPKVRGNSLHQIRYVQDELTLLKIRLNHAVDQWRSHHSDRRLICGHPRVDACPEFFAPMAGFLQESVVDDFQRRGNPLRDRRQFFGCVAFQFASVNSGKQMDECILSAARSLRKYMRRCDLGIRCGNCTLVVLRPSSALGECWLWAEDVRQKLELLSLQSSQCVVIVGLSAQEFPMAGLCSSTLLAAVALAEYSAQQKGGCLQTPMMQLLDSHSFWSKLRAFPLPARRGYLLDCLRLSLGAAQLEHVGAHCEVVSRIGVEIADSYGLDDRNVETVRMAGLYHDIGKLLVPNDLLAKPGPLTAAEHDLMMKHDFWGADICTLLHLGTTIHDAVRDHHVRFEHSRYHVSLFGRIVSVADAIAAMAGPREYCSAQPIEVALEELRRGSGKQFDPLVVHAVTSECAMLRLSKRVAANN
jgi:putative nucleotidyltransferase with HDIG domain